MIQFKTTHDESSNERSLDRISFGTLLEECDLERSTIDHPKIVILKDQQ